MIIDSHESWASTNYLEISCWSCPPSKVSRVWQDRVRGDGVRSTTHQTSSWSHGDGFDFSVVGDSFIDLDLWALASCFANFLQNLNNKCYSNKIKPTLLTQYYYVKIREDFKTIRRWTFFSQALNLIQGPTLYISRYFMIFRDKTQL